MPQVSGIVYIEKDENGKEYCKVKEFSFETVATHPDVNRQKPTPTSGNETTEVDEEDGDMEVIII